MGSRCDVEQVAWKPASKVRSLPPPRVSDFARAGSQDAMIPQRVLAGLGGRTRTPAALIDLICSGELLRSRAASTETSYSHIIHHSLHVPSLGTLRKAPIALAICMCPRTC